MASGLSGSLLAVGLLSLAVATVATTITRSSLFKFFRTAVANRSQRLGELVSCPYCTSHWLAFVAVAIYRPVVVTSGVYVLDLFVSALIIVAVASVAIGLIYRGITTNASS